MSFSNPRLILISKSRMGNHQQSSLYAPPLSNWSVVKRLQHCVIWRSTTSNQQLQQYQLSLPNSSQLSEHLSTFHFRLSSQTLVSSKYFSQSTSPQLCSSHSTASIFLERIPLRLSHIQDIPYPDVLHLYHQAFRGFAELFDRVGYFEVEEDMIGVNQQGRVKVWLSGELERRGPRGNAKGGEREMLRRLVEVVVGSTDGRTMPGDLEGVFRELQPKNFRDADIMVRNFAARYGIDIPSQMDSILARSELLSSVGARELHRIGPSQANYRDGTRFNTEHDHVVTTQTRPMIRNLSQNQFFSQIKPPCRQIIPLGQSFEPPTHSTIPASPINDMAALMSQPKLQNVQVQNKRALRQPSGFQILSPPKEAPHSNALKGIENYNESNRGFKQLYKINSSINNPTKTMNNRVLVSTAPSSQNNSFVMNKNHNSMLNLGIAQRFTSRGNPVAVENKNQSSQKVMQIMVPQQSIQQKVACSPAIKIENPTLSKSTSSPSFLINTIQKIQNKSALPQSSRVNIQTLNRAQLQAKKVVQGIHTEPISPIKCNNIAHKSSETLIQDFSPLKSEDNEKPTIFSPTMSFGQPPPKKIHVSEQKIMNNLPVSLIMQSQKTNEQQFKPAKTKINKLAEGSQMKYSIYQENPTVIDIKDRTRPLQEANKHKDSQLPRFGKPKSPEVPLKQGEYSVSIDQELMNDLQKLRKVGKMK